MNIFKEAVIFITNSHLNKSRKAIDMYLSKHPDFKNNFDKDFVTLNKIYQEAYYWHGTGRYQYKTIGNSKYESVSTKQKFDVLENIFKEGGLRPHEDPWIKTNGEYSRSISTTKFRLYARLYSQLHMFKGADIKLSYGDRLFFSKFFIYYTFANATPLVIIKFILASFLKQFKTKGIIWAKTINSNLKSKGNSMSDFINIVGKERSNIKGNIGILIGIKKEGVKPVEMNKYIQLLETRSRERVDLKYFSHLEAPIKDVQNIIKLTKKYGVSIPIIPIEFGEIYFSKYNIQKLLDFNK